MRVLMLTSDSSLMCGIARHVLTVSRGRKTRGVEVEGGSGLEIAGRKVVARHFGLKAIARQLKEFYAG